MPDLEEPENLAEMVRARARSRGDAIAYEFEGRRTSFAELDILTNRVANALRAAVITRPLSLRKFPKASSIRMTGC